MGSKEENPEGKVGLCEENCEYCTSTIKFPSAPNKSARILFAQDVNGF